MYAQPSVVAVDFCFHCAREELNGSERPMKCAMKLKYQRRFVRNQVLKSKELLSGGRCRI